MIIFGGPGKNQVFLFGRATLKEISAKCRQSHLHAPAAALIPLSEWTVNGDDLSD